MKRMIPVEYGQIGLCDVEHSLPRVEAFVQERFKVLLEAQPLKDMPEVIHQRFWGPNPGAGDVSFSRLCA